MKGKRLLAIVLVCALFAGAAVITNAAELDLAWYAANNPDVAAVAGNSPEMLRAHYELFGRKEGRMANEHDIEAQLRRLFNAEEYAALYPDEKALFGDDTEAMFEHYMAFGLLEGRRPSEKVSEIAALSLKINVEKALKEADIMVQPGCAQLVEIITGTISKDVGGKKMQQALTKAAPMVEKAVMEAVEEVTNPKPKEASSDNVLSGGQTVDSLPVMTPDSVAERSDVAGAKADWAPLSDHADSSDGKTKEELKQINEAMAGRVKTAPHDKYTDITVVTFDFPENTVIPEHTNANGDTAYFFGIGVPYNGKGFIYNWGFTSGKERDEENAAIEAVNAGFSENKGKTSEDGDNATFYWGLTSKKEGTDRWGYLAVKDVDGTVVAKYIIDFTELHFGHR